MGLPPSFLLPQHIPSLSAADLIDYQPGQVLCTPPPHSLHIFPFLILVLASSHGNEDLPCQIRSPDQILCPPTGGGSHGMHGDLTLSLSAPLMPAKVWLLSAASGSVCMFARSCSSAP